MGHDMAPETTAADATAPPTARRWLIAAALLVLMPAVAFARRYPLAGNTDRLTDIGFLSDYGVTELVGYVGGLALMFGGYVWGIVLCRRLPPRRALPVVFAGGAAAALAMAWMYPVTAIDLFIYVVRSRIFTAYGADPLAVPPVAFPNDPLMALASQEWGDNVSPYGPLWTLVAAPITAATGADVGLALAGFKALAVAATLAGGWIVARTLAVAAPERTALGALIYLWNPLVLWEGVGNGHNDVVMMLPVLLAMAAWVRRRDALVLPALVAAAAIKYVAIVLLPLAAVAIWRRRRVRPVAGAAWASGAGGASSAPVGGRSFVAAGALGGVAPDAPDAGRGRTLAIGAALSLLVLVVAVAPFRDLGAVWGSVSAQGGISLTSPAAVAISILRETALGGDARWLVRGVSLALFGVALVGILAWLWRRPDALPWGAFETLFLLLMIATWNWRPWYLIWLVGLVALLPLGWPAARAIVWSAGGLAGYALFIWVWEWWDAPFAEVQLVGVLLMTGPALLVSAIALRRERPPTERRHRG